MIKEMLARVRRTLQRPVGHALDMIPRAEADKASETLREEVKSWRRRYDEMAGLRVSTTTEGCYQSVVCVRVEVGNIKSLSERDTLLRMAIQQLSKQAGW